MRAKEKLILEEAIRCIRERGIKETNSNIIAARLGMQTSNVFYYFPKQQDLYDRLIEYCVNFNQELLLKFMEDVAGKSVEKQMHAYFKGNLAWAAKHPEQVAVFLAGASDPNPKNSLRKVVLSALEAGEAKISSILAHGVAREEINLRYSLEQSAQIIHVSLVGAVVMLQVRGAKYEKASLEKVKKCFESLSLK